MSSTIERSVFGANLHCLHAGLGFRLGLEHAVVDNGRRSRRRLPVDNGAFLGGRIANDVVLGSLCISPVAANATTIPDIRSFFMNSSSFR